MVQRHRLPTRIVVNLLLLVGDLQGGAGVCVCAIMERKMALSRGSAGACA